MYRMMFKCICRQLVAHMICVVNSYHLLIEILLLDLYTLEAAETKQRQVGRRTRTSRSISARRGVGTSRAFRNIEAYIVTFFLCLLLCPVGSKGPKNQSFRSQVPFRSLCLGPKAPLFGSLDP